MKTLEKYWWIPVLGAIAAAIAFLLTRKKKTQPAQPNSTNTTNSTTLEDAANNQGQELLSQYLAVNIPVNTGFVGPSLPPEPEYGQGWDYYTRPADEPAWYEFWK